MSFPIEVATLTCWKDIANYLGKGVRTVQRWEQEFGLPIRRPKGATHKSPVSANPRDLDAWLESSWSVRAAKSEENGAHAPDESQKEACSRILEDSRNLLQDSRNSVRMASDIRASVHLARQQHKELIHELSVVIATLNSTCRLLAISHKPTSDS